MTVFLIALCVIMLVSQNILKKQFGKENISADFTYSGITTLFALLFFIVTAKNPPFSGEIIIYSVLFALAYITTTVTMVLSLKLGSLAITSLIFSYSLIIPTVYGFLRGEAIGALKITGFLILLVSTFLIRAEDKNKGEKKASLKWIIAVIVAFVSNGFCSVIQAEQESKFSGKYNSSFMIIALAIGTVFSLTVGVIKEHKVLKPMLRKGFFNAALCGLCNGLTNYLVMVIIASVAVSLFFPVISAAQLILIFTVSVGFYKEKFIPRQLLGLGLGLISIVLLNI